MIEEKYRKEFGAYLRKLRKEAGLPQAAVSDECGYVSSQFISNIERGAAWPPMDMMIKLCKLYGVRREEMLQIFSSYRNKIWAIEMGIKSRAK